MNLQLLAYNGATIPMPAEGYRLHPDAAALLPRYTRERTGLYFVCTIDDDRRLYLLDMPGVLRRLVGLRDSGHDPVVPVDEIVSDFTVPIRG